MRVMLSLALGCALTVLPGRASALETNWPKVDALLGRAAVVSGDAHRYGFPRGDLEVTVDGVAIKPALALSGWIAFKPMQREAAVMGDLVLLESEINPVMSRLLDGGLDVTAVHNHLLRASPATFHMHVGGQGDPVRMAAVIRSALAMSKTPLEASPAAATPPGTDLDTMQLYEIIGVKGRPNGGVYQFALPRRDPVTEEGMPLAPAGPMGVATGIGFQPTGAGRAAITGDFVLTRDEVTPVARALRQNGIEVTAIHSHMLSEQPRLTFMHFWANGDAERLARGLRAALDKTATTKGP